jgi:hypothetical protein
VAGTIRPELSSLDPRTPLLSVSTLQAFTEGSPFHWRFRAGARVFTLFGLADLVLTMVGIWGINVYTALRRSAKSASVQRSACRPATSSG